MSVLYCKKRDSESNQLEWIWMCTVTIVIYMQIWNGPTPRCKQSLNSQCLSENNVSLFVQTGAVYLASDNHTANYQSSEKNISIGGILIINYFHSIEHWLKYTYILLYVYCLLNGLKFPVRLYNSLNYEFARDITKTMIIGNILVFPICGPVWRSQ